MRREDASTKICKTILGFVKLWSYIILLQLVNGNEPFNSFRPVLLLRDQLEYVGAMGISGSLSR